MSVVQPSCCVSCPFVVWSEVGCYRQVSPSHFKDCLQDVLPCLYILVAWSGLVRPFILPSRQAVPYPFTFPCALEDIVSGRSTDVANCDHLEMNPASVVQKQLLPGLMGLCTCNGNPALGLKGPRSVPGISKYIFPMAVTEVSFNFDVHTVLNPDSLLYMVSDDVIIEHNVG